MHDDKTEGEVNVALSSAIFLFSGIGLLSLIITGIIILAVPLFTESETNGPLVQLLVAILGLKASLLFPLSSFNGVLVAKYRFDVMSYIKLVSLLLRTAFIVTFVSIGYDVVAVACITTVDAVIVSLVTVYCAKNYFPGLRVSPSLINMGKLKEYYDFGKYTYITTIADRVRFSVDDLVVGAFIGVGAVTHYTIVVALLRYFIELLEGAVGVISPVFNQYHKLDQWDKLRDVFLAVTEVSAMLAVLVGGLLMVLGEPFIIIWMGNDYRDIYIVLLVLCPVIIVDQAQRPSLAILYAIAKHKYYAKMISLEAIANVCISIVLVQYLGIIGVALGTVIPLLFNKMLLQPIYTCRQLQISLKHYYFKVFKYIFCGLIIFYLAFFVNSNYIVLDSYMTLVLAGSVICSAYIIVCMKFVISDKARKYIIDMFPEKIRPVIMFVS